MAHLYACGRFLSPSAALRCAGRRRQPALPEITEIELPATGRAAAGICLVPGVAAPVSAIAAAPVGSSCPIPGARPAPIRGAAIGIWLPTPVAVAVAIAVTIRIAAAVVIRRRDRGAQRETSHYSARPPPTARAPAPTTAPSPATAPSPPYIDNV